jgi:deoxyribodipyrimidine photolyase-like uncharacterized protein
MAGSLASLYWDYLDRHADQRAKNSRMLMQLKHLNRLTSTQHERITFQAKSIKEPARASIQTRYIRIHFKRPMDWKRYGH